MIKLDVVKAVSAAAEIPQARAELAVEEILAMFKAALAGGARIELRGFGVFTVKPRKKGMGRNPRTGKVVVIPPGRTIRFKPGKDLKDL
jgi:nucleoid DNA-binding protein